jgi:glycerol-3-phosphate O-acyltransferase / dihydroxyacetone phosphate acyltransferase
MWLLPALPAFARVAAGTYYRLRVAGERVPGDGPCLVVSNHPNSLLDPALVMAAAGRPIRFLAKAPLFTDRLVGWLVRAAGAIPIYRRADDETIVERNGDSFAAAHAALIGGSAIGIFPEGTSHDEPSLAPLRTGAARIALGAAAFTGVAFPIVPIGLVFREKQTYRSQARLVVGRAVEWSDLAAAGQDAGAVRELTARIDDALRGVTLNLERWEDAPLLETAEAIWSAELGAAGGRGGDVAALDRLHRLRIGAQRLAELRRSGDERWATLAARVLRHGRLLYRLGLTPGALHGEAGAGEAVRWTIGRLPALGVVASGLGALGAVLFWPPYRATGAVAAALKPTLDTRSTAKLLAGIPIYTAWVLLLAALVGAAFGIGWALLAALLLPAFGAATLHARERWRESRREVRRFLLKRTRPGAVAELRARQRRLAEEISALVAPVEAA